MVSLCLCDVYTGGTAVDPTPLICHHLLDALSKGCGRGRVSGQQYGHHTHWCAAVTAQAWRHTTTRGTLVCWLGALVMAQAWRHTTTSSTLVCWLGAMVMAQAWCTPQLVDVVTSSVCGLGPLVMFTATLSMLIQGLVPLCYWSDEVWEYKCWLSGLVVKRALDSVR